MQGFCQEEYEWQQAASCVGSTLERASEKLSIDDGRFPRSTMENFSIDDGRFLDRRWKIPRTYVPDLPEPPFQRATFVLDKKGHAAYAGSSIAEYGCTPPCITPATIEGRGTPYANSQAFCQRT
jgi:hypothetical protein